jgi:hypothetical protein
MKKYRLIITVLEDEGGGWEENLDMAETLLETGYLKELNKAYDALLENANRLYRQGWIGRL